MDIVNSIKKHVSNKNVVHLSMLAFAVTSTLNIAGFFVATEHYVIVAASIGLALGAGLMAVSVYLSRQELWSQNFYLLLVAAVCMALLSGQIQSMAYQLHGLDAFTAYLLGYAPPFVIEILLALAVSLAERSEREQVQRDSKRFIKDSVAESMTMAFRNIDASRIQKHIEKSVDGVIKAFVDDALGEMMGELNANRRAPIVQPTTAADNQNVQIEQSQAPQSNSLDVANEQRQREIEQRRNRIMNIMSEHITLGVSELHHLLGGEEVCSRGTLNNDLKALADDGSVYNADRKWHLASVVNALPARLEPTVNGHSR